MTKRGRGRLRRGAAVGAVMCAVLAAPTAPAAAGSGTGGNGTAGSGTGGCHHPAVLRALGRLTGEDGITGAAVRVERPGCPAWSAALGRADVRTGRPMRAGDRIRIGSTTKTFTATVVLQLVAEHRIGLDDTVEDHLPGLIDRHGYDGRRITVAQLLRHTSGLPDHTDALDWEHPEEWRAHDFTARELVALALERPRPERAWSYSTTNYVVLGMIVEKVTGRTAAREAERRIIGPLGLRDTYWPGTARTIEGPHPRGYEWRTRGGRRVLSDVTELNTTVGGAGGALVSTLADQNRFFAALLGGRLLPPAQLALMRTTVAADPDRVWPGARYGLGLISTPLDCGGRFWGHGGTTPGFETDGGATPDGRRVQLVLNQTVDTRKTFDDKLALVRTALCENR